MTLNERIGSLANLGFLLQEDSDARKYAIGKAYFENKWFTEDQVIKMIDAVITQYLEFDALSDFCSRYPIPDNQKNVRTIGLIPAGNIPMVGFHDLLCILLSGHHAEVKLSEKDNVLLPFVMQLLESVNLELSRRVTFVDRLTSFGAVIATGSNNTSKIFERYFGKYPNIIRKNRTAIAILSGSETREELQGLAEDVFAYYGLGCRNISKIYVPEEYDFNELGEILNRYKKIVLHPKYKNNFDYNLAIHMLNKTKHINVGSLILVEDEKIQSRIASLHYQYFRDLDEITSRLRTEADKIQCVSSQIRLKDLPIVPFGQAQQPGLSDFADGVDTLSFLLEL